MALAKERLTKDSYSLYDSVHDDGVVPLVQAFDPSSLAYFGLKGHNKLATEDGEGFNYPLMNHPPPIFSDPSSLTGSGNFMFGTVNSKPKEAAFHQSILCFKAGSESFDFSSSSMLSFEQGEQITRTNSLKLDHGEDYGIWADAVESNQQLGHLNSKHGVKSRLTEDANCFEMASAKGSNQQIEEQFGWIYSNAMAGDELQEFGELEENFHKRSHSGGDVQAAKKHCAGNQRKPKTNAVVSKDPQSIAAKNRRERISERLKVLQELVPNGTKVDLVTMLEKAINYVKFLQLQVKVLATDEFWPSQGGKAPEITQVKEAIDAILSSHRNSNNISTSDRK